MKKIKFLIISSYCCSIFLSSLAIGNDDETRKFLIWKAKGKNVDNFVEIIVNQAPKNYVGLLRESTSQSGVITLTYRATSTYEVMHTRLYFFPRESGWRYIKENSATKGPLWHLGEQHLRAPIYKKDGKYMVDMNEAEKRHFEPVEPDELNQNLNTAKNSLNVILAEFLLSELRKPNSYFRKFVTKESEEPENDVKLIKEKLEKQPATALDYFYKAKPEEVSSVYQSYYTGD